MEEIRGIRVVDPAADMSSFAKHLADCVVLTHDRKLLLQYRPPSWRKTEFSLNIFGGHVEPGESPVEAAIRELGEELGARINPGDLVPLASVTEDFTRHTECVHLFFWHDRHNTITGCYEAEARSFDTANEVLAHPAVMDYARWAVRAAQDRGLLAPGRPAPASALAP